MKLTIVFLVVLISAGNAFAGEPSPNTHYMTVEYKKAPNGGVAQVQVTFFEKMPKDRAAVILRAEFQAMIAAYPPTQNVLANAWDADENMIGEQLIYVVNGKKIIKFSDYEAAHK